MRPLLLATFAAASLALARPAAADDKRDCVASSDAAQSRRSEGHLVAARTELLSCARPVCPALVRQFCEKWLEEVQAVTPSVVIRVSDSEGRDATDARVLIDGRLAASTLDGRPLIVDPGVHLFRFEVAGAAPFERKIVVVEGEKDRMLAEKIPASMPAPAAPLAAPPEAATPARHVPLGLYVVLGGVGVAGLATFGYLAATGQSDYAACASHGCSSSAQSSLDVRRVVAWTSLGAGVAALGAGAAIYAVGRSRGGARVGLAPTAGGAFAQVLADF